MRIALAVFLVACTAPTTPVTVDPSESGDSDGGKADGPGTSTAIPDVRCSGEPDAGPAGDFRHLSSEITAAVGSPRHRGFDLVATADDDTQSLEGWISYGTVDKALEDEDVDLFACRAGSWAAIGSARTDDEGHFALPLSGGARLPIAMRDVFVSVVGDRTGAAFLAYVAPADQPLIVSDVDGTLTSSENAFFETIALGIEPDAQPGAAAAYRAAALRGYQLVYVTARGSQYTTDTRQWLADKGFPRGPVRLSPSFVTLPGADTIDYKTSTVGALALPVAWGVGNRASDITAYTNVGLDAQSIFILSAEYASEVQPQVDAGAAIGLASYDDLRTTYVPTLQVH
jgi:phosphatidate phosphatase PAH1